MAFSAKTLMDVVNSFLFYILIAPTFSGYRHVRLQSMRGEVLESATLFVHVIITNLNDAVAVSISLPYIFNGPFAE